jgi:thiamine phosphate synthase YjbQ (UPF0047 family)
VEPEPGRPDRQAVIPRTDEVAANVDAIVEKTGVKDGMVAVHVMGAP